MIIDYISTYRIPSNRAVGVQVINTCAALADEGNEVRLFLPEQRSQLSAAEIQAYYGVSSNFKIYSVALPQLHLPGLFLFLLRTALYLWRVKKKIRADAVVYAREQIVGLLFPNFIFEVHAMPSHITKLHRLLWRRAGGFITLTSFVRDSLIQSGFAPEKIHVAPDAISERHLEANISKQDARAAHDLPQDRRIIGYVGRYKTPFGEGKGVDELIAAFSKVREQVPESFLMLVGMSNVEEVRAQCEKAKLAHEDYTVRPYVSQQEVLAYYHAADVLVMNYPWSEHHAYQMSPMKLFEYMAARRPIVASALPSVLEIVDKTSACLVEPGDEQALIRGIVRVLRDEAYAADIAGNAFEEVKRYTWENRASGISLFLEHLR